METDRTKVDWKNAYDGKAVEVWHFNKKRDEMSFETYDSSITNELKEGTEAKTIVTDKYDK